MAKKKNSNILKVKIIGCGGIGCCLLDPLCRYLNYSEYPNIEVSLIDGDTYEERNKERQIFQVAGPKATITAERLRQDFQRLNFWDHPVYLGEHNQITMLRDGDIIFSCVDNHKTRKLISDRAEELDNVVVISGGNDFEDGNVQVHIKENGQDITLPIANKYHPEIVNPTDKNPGDYDEERMGCQEMAAVTPQLLIMNNIIAAHMLSTFYGVLKKYHEKKPTDFSEWYIDIRDGQSKSRSRI